MKLQDKPAFPRHLVLAVGTLKPFPNGGQKKKRNETWRKGSEKRMELNCNGRKFCDLSDAGTVEMVVSCTDCALGSCHAMWGCKVRRSCQVLEKITTPRRALSTSSRSFFTFQSAPFSVLPYGVKSECFCNFRVIVNQNLWSSRRVSS